MKGRDIKNIKAIEICDLTDNLDFKKIKKSGIDIVIFKSGEGLKGYGKKLEKVYKKAKEENLKVGVCHVYFDKILANLQAYKFYITIKNLKIDVIPILEIKSNKKGKEKKEFSDKCLHFFKVFKNLSGYDCMIKTTAKFINESLDIRLRKHMLLIEQGGADRPDNNTVWSEWCGFEYSKDVSIADIDIKVNKIEFTEKVIVSMCNCGCCHKDSGDDNKKQHKCCESGNVLSDELCKKSIQGEEVKILQSQLNIQFNKGIPVDGCFNETTLNATVTVALGAKGDLTKLIQRRLIKKGFSVGKYGVDGVFGKDTLKAVKAFNKSRKINGKGVVVRETWKALFEK